jgi:hypothetical protein
MTSISMMTVLRMMEIILKSLYQDIEQKYKTFKVSGRNFQGKGLHHGLWHAYVLWTGGAVFI